MEEERNKYEGNSFEIVGAVNVITIVYRIRLHNSSLAHIVQWTAFTTDILLKL